MSVPVPAPTAAVRRTLRLLVLGVIAFVLVAGGLAATPARTVAASPVKVVIVVGPVESTTSRYKSIARSYAALARANGASVTEVYSPIATWGRVANAARGANILIYLGHGNGYPSPYGPFVASRRNGMGLNASAHHGHANVKYYGQTYMRQLALAPNAVVLLNHLCYASGNSEPGRTLPSKTTAKKRADGYASGFLRSGAKAVFANGHGSLDAVLTDLLTSDKTVEQMFLDDSSFDGARDFQFASVNISWATVWMDPQASSRYYHAVTGVLSLSATQIRGG